LVAIARLQSLDRSHNLVFVSAVWTFRESGRRKNLRGFLWPNIRKFWFQACLDREIKSGSVSAGLATRYDFTKHFEQLPFSGSHYFLPLQTRSFLRPVPKSQNFHYLRCLNKP
jgi:hypothetical protein